MLGGDGRFQQLPSSELNAERGDEYNVMRLASYGEPEYLDAFRDIVRSHPRKGFGLNLKYLRHHRDGVDMMWDDGPPRVGPLWSEGLGEQLGPARDSEGEIEPRHQNIAASLQVRPEEVLFEMLRRMYERTGLDALWLAGVAYNWAANDRTFSEIPFPGVYVLLAPGDAGLAIGARASVGLAPGGAPSLRVQDGWGRLRTGIPGIGDAGSPRATVAAGRRMRVLFLNRAFPPDVEATGQYLIELGVDLSRAHEVMVLCGRPNLGVLEGRVFPYRHDRIGPVEVWRAWGTRWPKSIPLARMLNQASFFGMAALAVRALLPPDVVVCLTDPPFLGLLALRLKRRFSVPFVYYCHDLYPDVAEAVGMARGPLVSAFEAIQARMLAGADRVVALGDDMAARLAVKGVAEDRLCVIRNWADTETIRPIKGENLVPDASRAC